MPMPRRYRNIPTDALPEYVRVRYARYTRPAMLARRLSRPAAAVILAGQLGATITAQSAAVGLAVAFFAVLITAPVLPE